MAESQATRFATTREEYESGKGGKDLVVYTAALHLPSTVKPMCAELAEISNAASNVSIFNPFTSFLRLRVLRQKFLVREPVFRAELEACLKKLAEPVEGSTALEMGWIQGFTLAAGISAVLQLNLALSTASETLDRKAAYTLACFSLYIAVVSLIATVVLGALSLK